MYFPQHVHAYMPADQGVIEGTTIKWNFKLYSNTIHALDWSIGAAMLYSLWTIPTLDLTVIRH